MNHNDRVAQAIVATICWACDIRGGCSARRRAWAAAGAGYSLDRAVAEVDTGQVVTWDFESHTGTFGACSGELGRWRLAGNRPLRRANRAGYWRLASELARGFRGGNVGTHGAVLVEAHRSGRQAETPPAAGVRPGVGDGGEVAQRARDRLGDDGRDARECDGFDDTRQPFRGAGAAVNFRAVTAPVRRF